MCKVGGKEDEFSFIDMNEQNDLVEVAKAMECLCLFQAKSKNYPLSLLSLLLSTLLYSF